jgi:hypothetical protein
MAWCPVVVRRFDGAPWCGRWFWWNDHRRPRLILNHRGCGNAVALIWPQAAQCCRRSHVAGRSGDRWRNRWPAGLHQNDGRVAALHLSEHSDDTWPDDTAGHHVAEPRFARAVGMLNHGDGPGVGAAREQDQTKAKALGQQGLHAEWLSFSRLGLQVAFSPLRPPLRRPLALAYRACPAPSSTWALRRIRFLCPC